MDIFINVYSIYRRKSPCTIFLRVIFSFVAKRVGDILVIVLVGIKHKAASGRKLQMGMFGIRLRAVHFVCQLNKASANLTFFSHEFTNELTLRMGLTFNSSRCSSSPVSMSNFNDADV